MFFLKKKHILGEDLDRVFKGGLSNSPQLGFTSGALPIHMLVKKSTKGRKMGQPRSQSPKGSLGSKIPKKEGDDKLI